MIECSACGVPKPESEYRVYKGKRHGRQCKPCQWARDKAQSRRYKEKNPDKYRATRRLSNQRLKAQTMAAYGGVCACCGESELMFLTLDHSDGDGKEHRSAVKRRTSGSYFYRLLRDAGWPNDPPLRVMCWNCNFASYWGECPHREKEAD